MVSESYIESLSERYDVNLIKKEVLKEGIEDAIKTYSVDKLKILVTKMKVAAENLDIPHLKSLLGKLPHMNIDLNKVESMVKKKGGAQFESNYHYALKVVKNSLPKLTDFQAKTLALSTCIPTDPTSFTKADVQDNLSRSISNVRKYESRLENSEDGMDTQTAIMFAVMIAIILSAIAAVGVIAYEMSTGGLSGTAIVVILYLTVVFLIWRKIEKG